MVRILGPTHLQAKQGTDTTGNFGRFQVNPWWSRFPLSRYWRARLRRRAHWFGRKMFSCWRTTRKTGYQTPALQKSLPYKYTYLLSITPSMESSSSEKKREEKSQSQKLVIGLDDDRLRELEGFYGMQWSEKAGHIPRHRDDTLFNQSTNTSSSISTGCFNFGILS